MPYSEPKYIFAKQHQSSPKLPKPQPLLQQTYQSSRSPTIHILTSLQKYKIHKTPKNSPQYPENKINSHHVQTNGRQITNFK